MIIRIELNEIDFSEAEARTVLDSLDVSEDDDENVALSRLAKSAFLEYKKMFVGRGLPTRADEVMQDRLLFLIKNYFVDRLPFEYEIAKIFQLPPSQSRTLLRNTRSRFRTELGDVIRATLRSVLESGEQREEGDWELTITSDAVVEEIGMILLQKGTGLQPLKKKARETGRYICAADTCALLQSVVGVSNE